MTTGLSVKRLSQDDIDQIAEYGHKALSAIEDCQKELAKHMQKIEKMESKYLVKKFDDVEDIYRELNQMSENIEKTIQQAKVMGEMWFAIDANHNLVGL